MLIVGEEQKLVINEDIVFHKSIETNIYGSTDDKDQEIRDSVIEALNTRKISEDKYVKIYAGNNTRKFDQYFVLINVATYGSKKLKMNAYGRFSYVVNNL